MRAAGPWRAELKRLRPVPIAAAVVLALAPESHAACRTGNPGVSDYVCSGIVNNVGPGLSATPPTGNVSVTIRSGSVTGTTNGVTAATTAAGTISVIANGNATGTNGFGIQTISPLGYSQIDIGSAATVSGVNGVSVTTSGAYGILNNAGAIVGDSTGLILDLGVGSESVNNNGSIMGTAGTAVRVRPGSTVTINTNAGGLINGAIAADVMTTVNNDGIWKKAGGSSIGSFVSSGTLSLGAAGTQVLLIGGDATFKAGATTVLNLAPGGASDLVSVVGDLTVGGALVLHGTGTGYTSGTRYVLLTSQGSVAGSFTSVTTDIPKFLPIFASSGTDFSVVLAQYDFRDLALTRNQYAAATMVTQAAIAPLTPAGTSVLFALDGMTPDGVRNALTQMAGEGVTAAKSVALHQGSLFMDTIAEQQTFWRSRETVDPNGITLGWTASAAPLPPGPGWYAGQPQPLPVRPLPVLLPPDRTLRLWVSGFGSRETTGAVVRDSTAGRMGQIGGAAVGMDAQLGRNLLLGVAGGYSVGSFSVSERVTSGSNTALHAAMYGGFTGNGFYGSTTIGYSSISTSTKRTVALATLPVEQETGQSSSGEFRVRLEAGKLIDLGVGSVTGFTALQGATLTTRPYLESSVSSVGAGLLALAFPSQTTHSVPVEIGFRAETRLRMGVATLAPWLQVSLVHDFTTARNNLAMLAAFPGVAQTVYGTPDARDTLRLRGGAQLTFTARAALFVSAEADLAKSQRVYAGKGGFRYGW